LNKSATNLAATAGDSPATKRSISTSEETDGVNGESGEPPVKRVATGEEEGKDGETGGVESLGVGEPAADAETAGAD